MCALCYYGYTAALRFLEQFQESVTKIADLKVGMRVIDRDYLCRGAGTVVTLLKTRVRINFSGEFTTYDAAHCQFLGAPVKRKAAPGGTHAPDRLVAL